MVFASVYFLLVAIALALYTFFGIKHNDWRALLVPVFLVGILLVIGFGLVTSFGSCRPAWLSTPTIDVVAIVYEEPKAIYVFGHTQEKVMCVALPWKEAEAKETRKKEKGGQPLILTPGGVKEKPIERLPIKTEERE